MLINHWNGISSYTNITVGPINLTNKSSVGMGVYSNLFKFQSNSTYKSLDMTYCKNHGFPYILYVRGQPLISYTENVWENHDF